MSETIQLVVFDIAGTTVRDDDGVNRCLRAALTAAGCIVSADRVNSVMGIPKPRAIGLLLTEINGHAPSAQDVARIHDDFLERMLSFYRTDPGVQPTEGAEEVIAQLRQAGVKVALDTGFSRETVEVVLERLGWTGSRMVDFTVASDEVREGRPEPDLVFECMRQAGVSAAECVAKVGDTPSDLLEGKNAGCGLIIGVTNGTHTREQLLVHPHTHLVKSLREVPSLILNR